MNKLNIKNSITLLLLSAMVLIGAGGCSQKQAPTAGKIYTCSMHPQIRQDHPGDCPICGMKLVPVVASSAVSPSADPHASHTPEQHAMAKTADPGPPAGRPVVHLGEAREAVASIATEKAGPRAMLKKIQLFGEVEYISDRHYDYSWYYAGRIQDVLIDFNTTEVEKGQPIYQVYSEAAIADQEAYLDALRERWLSTFYERKVLSAKVGAIRGKLLQAGFSEGDLRALEKDKLVRSTFTLRSPVRGSIVGKLLHRGEQFEANATLFHVVPLDEVWFSAQVYESDLGYLKLGQSIRIETKSGADSGHQGKLVFIDRTVRPETRTVNARFLAANPGRKLLPGLSAVGTLSVPLRDVLVAVPKSAVIDTGKRKVAYVKTGPGVFEQRLVETGAESEDAVEILRGIAAGEAVVARGAFLVDAEAQLQGGAAEHKHE
ncbi:MAG: efflux RND transporter periplasmic adaptor subunit [Candidatus Methylacidiphilales bacterium]|nr:efflux RND transporter periplasmic adaptor subunit [Candidatus Methylacidiphilales bacterium]